MSYGVRKYSDIVPKPKDLWYPLAYQQERVLYLSQLQPDSTIWGLISCKRLKGKLDITLLSDSIRELMDVHPVLRTKIGYLDHGPVQKLVANDFNRLEVIDFSHLNVGQAAAEALEYYSEECKAAINVEGDRLFKAILIVISENEYMLILKIHHIISDATSLQIMWEDLKQIYNLSGRSEGLTPQAGVDFQDYVLWQREMFDALHTKEQEEYWLNEFKGEIPVLDLPHDFPSGSGFNFNGAFTKCELPQTLIPSLKVLCLQKRVILFSALLAAYYVLLHKYSRQNDIIVGTVFSGRHYSPKLQNVAGFFVNTVGLRMDVDENLTFAQFLKQVHQKIDDAYFMQDYPVERIIEKIKPDRHMSRNPLFRAMFNMVTTNNEGSSFAGIEAESAVDALVDSTQVDFLFDIRNNNEDIHIGVEYNSDIFRKETITRALQHYGNILQSIVDNPELKISELELLGPAEKELLLSEWNDTVVEYPRNKCIQELFEEQAEKAPENIAVVFDNSYLTYGELNARANKLARVLKSAGVEREDIVGIIADKSADLIIGIIGILKAGGVYMPIDTRFPVQRINYMLQDSAARVLLAQKGLDPRVEFAGVRIELGTEENSGFESTDLPVLNSSNDLAYVLYTSGSTGTPKGVLVEHMNVVRLVKSTNYIHFDTGDRIAQVGAPIFDATTFEIWSALLNGYRLYIVPNEILLHTQQLGEFILENRLTIMLLTTALFNKLSEEKPEIFASLRYLLVGGEALSARHINNVRKNCPELKIINVYGPTENATFSTCHLITEDYPTNIPIGVPISNSTVYILDDHNKLQPIGVIGELCVGGDGLARGYLNQPELTAERFIEHPFQTGSRIYRTGDLARWLPEGTVEFIGRKDGQVKIRGFRIELGEIEAKLAAHQAVKEVIVVAKDDQNGTKFLCAYLTMHEVVSPAELRTFLAADLPDYMLPTYFIQIPEMPLNQSGKIDKRALPEPEFTGNIESYVAPRDEIEQALAGIWQEVLGVQKIGVLDNFFEVGGHSLKATVIISRVNKAFGVEIALREMFDNPVISKLAERIRSSAKKAFTNIEPVAEQEFYPVSSSQKRMYLLNRLTKAGIEYNVPIEIHIDGPLDQERLIESLHTVVSRHESFRTSFDMIEGEIVQKVHPKVDFYVDYATVHDQEHLNSSIKNFVRPFDLSKAPLIRVGLIKTAEYKHILLVDMHHIIADGASLQILFKEIAELYQGKKLTIPRIQYKDYAIWQNEYLQTAEIKQQAEYWTELLNGELPVLDLPTDFPRPSLQTFDGDRISFMATRQTLEGLKSIAVKSGSTMFMVLLAAYNILLSKYSRQEDILVGTPISGRYHLDTKNVVGMFVNTLVLRNKPSGNLCFKDFLAEVRANALGAFENNEYQFEELVEKINATRDLSRNPIFDTMFILQNLGIAEMNIPGLQITAQEAEQKTAKFDLTLSALESPGELGFEFEYCTKLFRKETVERLAKHYLNILEQIVNNPDALLADIELITHEEINLIHREFNTNLLTSESTSCLHELFEQQVERTPYNVAVLFKDKELTYIELNQRANRLARKLVRNGVGVGCKVAIVCERSLEMIVGILAILKAGGAYVPIDFGYPQERKKYILEDSGANILLIEGKFANSIMADELGEKINTISLADENTGATEVSNLKVGIRPNDLAYIIYTSGSTGKPKGVMVEHKAIINTLQFLQAKYPLLENETYLLKTTFTFDVSIAELFGWFFEGGRLAILEPGAEKEPAKILQAVGQYKVTHMNFVPSMLSVFLDVLDKQELSALGTLKWVFSAGEALTPSLTTKFYKMIQGVRLENLYGPTEVSIYGTGYSVDKLHQDEFVPIGKPISNMKAYILDKYLKLQPPGVLGELCLTGEGLARGYLNRPDLTAEKFIPNPFEPGKQLYKTGDLVRWMADGNIEFRGRIDNQVKIRGFRIELGEIEAKLAAHQAVKEVIVVDKVDGSNTKFLCAYLTMHEEVSSAELRAYLSAELPEYMLPTYFIKMSEMPLNHSGKIDKRALPEPEFKENIATYVAPRDEIEQALAGIWQDVLEVERIGVYDNFFEIGGHSLKAMVIISRIDKEFGPEIALREMFDNPVISKLAELIRNSAKKTYSNIEPVDEQEFYPVSPSQKRMYLLNHLSKSGIEYNVPIELHIEGPLDRERLIESLHTIVSRHESFRTSFDMIEGEIVQKVHPEVDFHVDYLIDHDQARINSIITDFVRPFDLSKAPLIRVSLIKTAEYKHILLIDVHHIITDGASLKILFKELEDLYQGKELSVQRIQYKDYAIWQNAYLKTAEIQKQAKYWTGLLNDVLPVLDLPTDFSRPSLQTFDGDRISFTANKQTLEGLKSIAVKSGSTMFMVLLAAYNILLAKYCRQEDILVGTPIAGRYHLDIKNVMGMFVNTLVMRNKPYASLSFKDFLSQVRANALEAFANNEYQFEELVEKISATRDLSRNPIFDTMFVLQNQEIAEIEIPGLKITSQEAEQKIAKFDLTLSALERSGELDLEFEYCTKLFSKETVERLGKHYLKLLQSIVDNPELKISDLELLDPAEKKLLLEDWNNTVTEYPRSMCITELFEEQAEKAPENIAVVFEDSYLTYGELNARANKLARLLQSAGVERQAIVGIMAGKSIDFVVGIIGILKAGAVYMPIDTRFPAQRINYMLQDSSARVLLAEKNLEPRVEFAGVVIELGAEESSGYENTNLPELNSSSDLAYVMYTSGSTGTPKGVLVEHMNVVRLVKNINFINFAARDRIAQVGAPIFDATTFEIWGALLNGHRLYIIPNDILLNAQPLGEFILENRLTIMLFTTALFNKLAEEKPEIFAPLRYLVVGGEVLSPKHINNVRKSCPEVKIINAYGPTENAAISTVHLITKNYPTTIPIGVPISNSTVYILDEHSKLQPIGVIGELCVGGDGLARGYLNQPELTAEKFLEHPFQTGSRIYRTGDLAKWLPDGSIEFIGRKDSQVKIRGFRIELGEIEAKLAAHQAVKEVIVLAKDEGDTKYLCAYLTMQEDVSTAELRAYLAADLPEYMLPAYFIKIAEMPLNQSGKIDKRALPEPEFKGNSETYVAPKDEIEQAVADIWQDVLGIKRIGATDNFFEVGGHSLKATVVISRVNKEFGVEISLREMFDNPYISKLAECIRRTASARAKDGLILKEHSVDFRLDYSAAHAQKQHRKTIVLLKRGLQPEKNLFLVHDGTGRIEGYYRLAGFINNNFTVYAINLDEMVGFTPKHVSVEELAAKYVQQVKKIQPVGPYYIGGWSTGGLIGFEIVNQLEQANDKVSLCALIDSPPPGYYLFTDTAGFSLESEMNFISQRIPDQHLIGKLSSTSTVDEFWDCMLSNLETLQLDRELLLNAGDLELSTIIPYAAYLQPDELFYVINVIRTLQYARARYSPDRILNTTVHQFTAADSPFSNQTYWNKHCTNPKTYQVDGDHYSMLKAENIVSFAERFNKVLADLP